MKRESGLILPELEVATFQITSLHESDFLRGQRRRRGISDSAAFVMGLVGASKSDYLENKILDHTFNDPSYSAPTPYLALTTVVPTDTSTGASITEATYTGYARLAIATSDMSAAASGSKTNSAALTFAACTAGSSTIIGFAICDASGTGAGNILYWGTVTSTVISTTQTPPTVAIGALVVTED
jgi:hypothetical protein